MTKGIDTSTNDTPEGARLALPAWLDGRTIALLTTIVTASLTLGTMTQNLANRIDEVRRDLRSDIEMVRAELSSDIAGLDDRLRAVEIDVAAIRAAMTSFDSRLRAAEEHARHPVGSATAG